MFSKIAVFSLLASVAVASAVPYAEHAPLVPREDELTTTSTQYVYVTITRTIPDPAFGAVTSPPADITPGPQVSGNMTTVPTNTGSANVTTPPIPDATDDDTGAAVNVQVSKVLGLMGIVGAVAFLL